MTQSFSFSLSRFAKFITMSLIVGLLFFSQIPTKTVFAQGNNTDAAARKLSPEETDQNGPSGITNNVISPNLGGSPAAANSGKIFSSYFITIWQALIVIGALAMIFNFVNGGVEWITAGGETSKVSHARQRMTEAVVGMVILAGSFAIINYLSGLFGFNLLHIVVPHP